MPDIGQKQHIFYVNICALNLISRRLRDSYEKYDFSLFTRHVRVILKN
jgi:hypothetical protein